jgi:hypothetical protein
MWSASHGIDDADCAGKFAGQATGCMTAAGWRRRNNFEKGSNSRTSPPYPPRFLQPHAVALAPLLPHSLANCLRQLASTQD